MLSPLTACCAYADEQEERCPLLSTWLGSRTPGVSAQLSRCRVPHLTGAEVPSPNTGCPYCSCFLDLERGATHDAKLQRHVAYLLTAGDSLLT